MKKLIILGIWGFPFIGWSQLKVNVTNIKEVKGNLMIVLMSGEDEKVEELRIPVNSKNMIIALKGDLPKGNYSIKTYQDLNTNGELDKGFWGVPEEPYGFSNNPKGESGNRDFDESKFFYSGQLQTEKVILVH